MLERKNISGTVLPEEMQGKWLRLRNDALQIASLPFPRRYWQFNDLGEYSLHVFCDASIKAYTLVAFMLCIKMWQSRNMRPVLCLAKCD